MQIKVNLSKSELEGLHNQGAETSDTLYKLGFIWADKLIAKLAKAIERPKTPAKKSKAPFGRADLKGQLEQFRGHWRFVEGAKAATEPCLHCGRPLNRARLTRLGNGAIEGIGHLACAPKFMGLSVNEYVKPVDLYGMTINVAERRYATISPTTQNDPHRAVFNSYGQSPLALNTYTEEDTANTAAIARSLAKAA